MAESRTFNKVEGVSVNDLGYHLTSWFAQAKGMQADGAPTQNGFGIQAKEEGDGWKTISGTTMALQVNIFDAGTCIVMECAYGKWSDKVGAGVVGWFVFAPLAVTAIVGTVRQKKLPDEVFKEAERFLLSGGRSLYASVGRVIQAGEVKCPHCGALVDANMRFCTQCGGKLSASCPQCGHPVGATEKFCPECGTRLSETLVTVCVGCGEPLTPGVAFCSNCGTKVE